MPRFYAPRAALITLCACVDHRKFKFQSLFSRKGSSPDEPFALSQSIDCAKSLLFKILSLKFLLSIFCKALSEVPLCFQDFAERRGEGVGALLLC